MAMKFADKVKKIKRTDSVDFVTDGGEVISFKVVSVSQPQMDALNEKYNAMKPAVPTKRLPSAKGIKLVDDPENPEYVAEITRINMQRFYHLAILFLAPEERPEGEIEEQIEAIKEVELAGFTGKIVNKGLEISGLTDDKEAEEVEEGK